MAALVNGTSQLPSLNGWRAVAILLVLGAHLSFAAGFPAQYAGLVERCFDGNLGVRFFFTISGFLITWLLVREENEFGAISLKSFHARRALRILPVYLACLLALAVIQWTGLASQSCFAWLKSLTFTRNFNQTQPADSFLTAHFWSLSVEEQFYLFWPLVFVLLAGRPAKRIWFLIALLVINLVWKIIILLGAYDRHLHWLFQDQSTFLYLDCIAWGCLGAILVQARESALQSFFWRHPRSVFLAGSLCVLLPLAAGGRSGIQSFGFALLLLHSVLQPQFPPFRWLNRRWLAQVGVLSYSLYVWQQLIYWLWPVPRLWFLAPPATFAVAWISYRFMEKPFFRLRSGFRKHKRTAVEKPPSVTNSDNPCTQ